METVAHIVLISLFGLTIVDAILVFSSKNPLSYTRDFSERMNLGDPGVIRIKVTNNTIQPISFSLIEGYPVEMQIRSHSYSSVLTPNGNKEFDYTFTPKKRGQFVFNDAFFMIRSMFFLVSRRYVVEAKQIAHVYPSVVQMSKYELMVFHQQKTSNGIKRIRRLGNNSEFEQIKNYVQGDEIKSINWKATSRRSELMVNQYQEEKSQSVYCIIDKSRSMQMEANQLSMLDYAINSTLVMTNIAIKKGDKAGLITYSDKIGTVLSSDRSSAQMRRIHEELYNQKTQFKEGNFQLLYQTIHRTIKHRSLLILFTNFETEFAMRRAVPMLRRLNKKHELVVIFFENTDLQKLAFQPVQNSKEVYQATIAEKMISSKGKIAQELNKNGIQTLVTLPGDLSINTINKYLELKAKGSI